MDRLRKVIIFAFLFSLGHIQVLTRGQNMLNDGGVIYDCVDFYKQPAFQHPLLANHTFHHAMKPSSSPDMTMTFKSRGVSNNNRSSVEHMDVQFEGKSCPVGKVPIKRITKDELIRQRNLVKQYESHKFDMDAAEVIGAHYAMVRTKPYPPSIYYGAAAVLSVWIPDPVRVNEYSSARFVVRNGEDNMQVGWMVNPTMYRNKLAHIFIYTGAGKIQCFDTHCPGFVVVNRNTRIGAYLHPVSKRGGPIYEKLFAIQKDRGDGNWWLFLGRNFEPVGFWPYNIFTAGGLADVATSVAWGGQAYSPANAPYPPMGGGQFLTEDTDYDAACGFVSTMDEARIAVDATNVEKYINSYLYEVDIRGNVGGSYGNLVLYGGPGGNIGKNLTLKS